ncbi:hypothetical protein [Rhizosaccharibacter radicis]|uniref:Helix-turn-helix domain-containing protein n=1 Tax=Rhizosaccharibacter radicis TaxID=2782605 RepID=A0ABT1VW25_9PROT|nr:helix-turn-helix domain-containing protein [Acetobacteraceae bacterium KSS12]
MTGRTITVEGAMTPDDLRRELSQRCKHRGGQAAFARKAGVSPSTISSVLSGRLPVNEVIANAMGFFRPGFFQPARDQRRARDAAGS